MKLYFKNLDGLRFIAASLVIIHHAQFFKKEHGLGVIEALHTYTEHTAIMGVNLFFVLSGFLISYLLMRESAETGTINFRNFYIRRILRIWPLYMAYGIPLTVLAPYIFNWMGIEVPMDVPTVLTNLLFFLLFAVNIQIAFFPYNKGILEITWSVCVEEQFYLVWPALILGFRKRLKTLFIWMLIIGIGSKAMNLILPALTGISERKILDINYVLLFAKLDLFGMGMLAAHIWFHRDRHAEKLRRWFTRPMQYTVLIVTVLVVFSVIRSEWLSHYYFDHTLQAVLFAYLVIAAVSENSIFRLEQPFIRTMGKVSYGLYIFHPPVSQLILLVFIRVWPANSLLVYDLIYPLAAFAGTAVVAYWSYELFEKQFLKMKDGFAVIKTRT